LACEQGDITITLPKPQRSGAKSEGRFGKQDFVYLANENVYRCPAGATLTYRYTNEEHGQTLYRYWADACRTCPIKAQCTTGRERLRREHEEIVEAVQERLDKNPEAMRTRRETVEHPFDTIKMRMGATHFLMKTLPKVATEMALHVLAYNLTRKLNISGVRPVRAESQQQPHDVVHIGERHLAVAWHHSTFVSDRNGLHRVDRTAHAPRRVGAMLRFPRCAIARPAQELGSGKWRDAVALYLRRDPRVPWYGC
jgi:DDE family transposase